MAESRAHIVSLAHQFLSDRLRLGVWGKRNETFFFEVQFIYTVVLVSGIQRNDSVI